MPRYLSCSVSIFATKKLYAIRKLIDFWWVSCLHESVKHRTIFTRWIFYPWTGHTVTHAMSEGRCCRLTEHYRPIHASLMRDELYKIMQPNVYNKISLKRKRYFPERNYIACTWPYSIIICIDFTRKKPYVRYYLLILALVLRIFVDDSRCNMNLDERRSRNVCIFHREIVSWHAE